MTKEESDIDELLCQALPLTDDDRKHFIAQLRPDIRQRLMVLLAAAESVDRKQFLKGNIWQSVTSTGNSQSNELSGESHYDHFSPFGDPQETNEQKQIGLYRIIHKIGEGGMGVVYLAEQVEPIRRTVALKIIKTEAPPIDVVARFTAERQALALMSHPNIARVIDAGMTESNQPFFVMELVQGAPITNYCDSHKLSIRDRLALVIQACHAVQHAHQKGIIHRDLKPSNILVTDQDGTPQVKIIDFGLAKAVGRDTRLSDKTLYTKFGQIVGTLAYMSPEQAALAIDIDTRTDVYSLGVILYELLTGCTPFNQADIEKCPFDQLLRKIREEDVVRPSSRLHGKKDAVNSVADARQTHIRRLLSLVRGDLDWISLKALEKDRTRRYETASSFGDDLGRYMRGEPVNARPPSVAYLSKKFLVRNLLLVCGIGLTMLSILVGIVCTSWFAYIAFLAAESERNQNEIANQKSNELTVALKDLDANLARSQLFLAESRFNENRPNDAIDTLNSISEAHRGIEWKFAKQKFTGGYMTLHGHQFGVNVTDISPDGSMIASAGEGHEIRLWDATSCQEILQIQAHSHRIEALKFSPDGMTLASGIYDKTIKLWDVKTAALKLTYQGHDGPVSALDFSSEGELIASGSQSVIDNNSSSEKNEYAIQHQGVVKVWNALTGETIHSLTGHTNHVHDVKFSPDAKTLASSGMEIILWDFRNGEQIARMDKHGFHIPSISFSPDGNYLVSAGDRDQVAIIWDIRTQEPVHYLRGHSMFLTNALFGPDGKVVATASADQTIRLWDSQKGTLIRKLQGHRNWVNSIAFSSSGKTLVSASRDCTLKLWDIRLNDEARSDTYASEVNSLSICSNKQILAVGFGNLVQVYDLHNMDLISSILTSHKRAITSIALSPDGLRLATSGWDNLVCIWDVNKRVVERKLAAVTKPRSESISKITFSPDGQRLATAGAAVEVWDVNSGSRLLLLDKHRDHVFAVSFSNSGEWLASGSADQTAKIWNAKTGEVIKSLMEHDFWVTDLAFSPDDTSMACVSPGGSIVIWEVAEGRKLRTLKHGESAQRAIFIDKTRLVSAEDSAGDSTLKLWDVETGEELITLDGHIHRIHALAYDPIGQWIVSSDSQKSLKFWKPILQASEYRLELPRHKSARSTVIDATGNRVIAVCRDGETFAWDLTTRELLKVQTDLPVTDNLSNRSSDGRWLVIPGNEHVRLIDYNNCQSEPFSKMLQSKGPLFTQPPN